MPEGDTIFRTARALHKALSGHRATKFDTAYAHLARVNDDGPIAGRLIERCEAAGKHVLIVFEGDLILRTHLRMNGSWHLYRHGERWWRGPQAMRVRVDTADWVAVAFDVPVAEFVTAKQLVSTDPVAALGPDLLTPGFDRDEAIRRVRAAGALPIAQALLDQRLVAGIGNVYKSEVLFLAGVHPDTPASAVEQDALERVMDLARSLLQANVVDGTPAAIQTYRSLRRADRRSDPQDSLWVYSRAGKPCRKCGAAIASQKMGLDARATYWCPTCQAADKTVTD
ncbi:MAG: DNA-formamidopyrimidine glycosylase family protein [Acidobacteriota bacterium]|nr:DNA-formamidopyrimidine glycosylase family protein [Acidobacteriota bacterium]